MDRKHVIFEKLTVKETSQINGAREYRPYDGCHSTVFETREANRFEFEGILENPELTPETNGYCNS